MAAVSYAYLILPCIHMNYSLELKDVIKNGTVFLKVSKQANRLHGAERVEGELHQFV